MRKNEKHLIGGNKTDRTVMTQKRSPYLPTRTVNISITDKNSQYWPFAGIFFFEGGGGGGGGGGSLSKLTILGVYQNSRYC